MVVVSLVVQRMLRTNSFSKATGRLSSPLGPLPMSLLHFASHDSTTPSVAGEVVYIALSFPPVTCFNPSPSTVNGPDQASPLTHIHKHKQHNSLTPTRLIFVAVSFTYHKPPSHRGSTLHTTHDAMPAMISLPPCPGPPPTRPLPPIPKH